MLETLKQAVTVVGARCSDRALHRADLMVNYLTVGHWMRRHGHAPSRYPNRNALFAAVAGPIGRRRVLYLEFGVHQGRSLRRWSTLLTHPKAQLHGFDSFAGLPEDWRYGQPRGHFDMGGAVPTLADPRVHLHVGWFHATLPAFRPPPHDVLVVHCDADLYSSTHTILTCIQPWVRPGSLLLFDEFHDRAHEMRAFDEHLARSGHTYEAIAATASLSRVAFRCTLTAQRRAKDRPGVR